MTVPMAEASMVATKKQVVTVSDFLVDLRGLGRYEEERFFGRWLPKTNKEADQLEEDAREEDEKLREHKR
jgi:hypothetical protein